MANFQARSEDSKAFRKIAFEFGSYKLRYAWVSQRGYYPEDLDKANQDSHIEIENFAQAEGMKDCALFGVFDGHGKTGDICSQFARDKIPPALAKELGKMQEAGKVAGDVEPAYRKAFVDVNEMLHALGSCDDTMSGTTSSASSGIDMNAATVLSRCLKALTPRLPFPLPHGSHRPHPERHAVRCQCR